MSIALLFHFSTTAVASAHKNKKACENLLEANSEESDPFNNTLLLETFKRYRVSESSQKKIIEILNSPDSFENAPQKLAELLGIKFLIHATRASTLQFILKEGAVLPGTLALQKHKSKLYVSGEADGIGSYKRNSVFMAPVVARKTKKTPSPNGYVLLYFSTELLNRNDAGTSPVWNYGKTCNTFRENPIKFLHGLTGPRPEIIFSKKIPLDTLKYITLRKSRKTVPRDMNPHYWHVPYYSALEAAQKSKRKPPHGRSWQDVIFEENYFLSE